MATQWDPAPTPKCKFHDHLIHFPSWQFLSHSFVFFSSLTNNTCRKPCNSFKTLLLSFIHFSIPLVNTSAICHNPMLGLICSALLSVQFLLLGYCHYRQDNFLKYFFHCLFFVQKLIKQINW
jgi:hypothetical protein